MTKAVLKHLIGRIHQVCEDNQGHEDGDVAYELRQLLMTEEFKAAEKEVKPSKSEVADYWEKRISQFEAKGNEDYQMIERSIELLRED